MTRPTGPDEPGAWHHVMNRGARRAPIFLKDDHGVLFLEVLDEAVSARGVEVHAYALMPNHFHLLVRSVHGNLSRFMEDLGGNYSRRLNRLETWDGPLFRGRFKSQLVTEEARLQTLAPYIHLNPVRAGLALEPQDFRWTSHQAYIGLASRPRWLTTSRVLSLFGGAEALHETVLGYRRRTIPWPEDIDTGTGWRKLPALRPFGLPAEEPEPPMERAADPGVERVLDAVLAVADAPRTGLETVRHGPGGNPVRRLAVLALVQLTQLTQREIGQRMGMSPAQVAQILHRFRHRGPAMVDADLRAVEQEVSSGSA